jgi:hypothetical protein
VYGVPEYEVDVEAKCHGSVSVEASSLEEAQSKAEAWDDVDFGPADVVECFDFEIKGVRRA